MTGIENSVALSIAAAGQCLNPRLGAMILRPHKPSKSGSTRETYLKLRYLTTCTTRSRRTALITKVKDYVPRILLGNLLPHRMEISIHWQGLPLYHFSFMFMYNKTGYNHPLSRPT